MEGNDLSEEEYNELCLSTKHLDGVVANASSQRTSAGFMFNYLQPSNPCGIAAKYVFNGCILYYKI